MVCVAGLFLAVMMHLPLAAHLSRDVASDLGDPLLQAWQVAWGGHALVHQPLDYFEANTFWPHHRSLAFSDSLAGYAPAGLIGRGSAAALIRYNLLFHFSYALAFAGAWLLARELGAGRAGSSVAAAAFAYAPYRLSQNSHLHVLSSGGIPLSLFLLLRGYRRRRPAMVVAGWLVVAWQITLGFALGLQLAYLLAGLGAVVAVHWVRSRRPRLDPVLVRATVVGVIACVAVTATMASPYLDVVGDHPNARRTEAEVRKYSSPSKAFLAAPSTQLFWGRATRHVRDSIRPESELFPGLAVTSLAVIGLLAGVYSTRLRAGLALAIVLLGSLSLGFGLAGDWSPYRLLYEFAPGWDAIRTPGRIHTITTLGLALLAGAGAHRLLRSLKTRRPRIASFTYAGVAGLLVGAILIEGSALNRRGAGLIAGLAHPAVPRVPSGQLAAPGPQLHLPSGDEYNPTAQGWDDLIYMYWSTDGFPALVNGTSGFVPRSLAALRARMTKFPNAKTVKHLRSIGVRTVVLHPERAARTPWEDTATRPVTGLRLVREERGGVVLYHIKPGARGSSQRRSASRGLLRRNVQAPATKIATVAASGTSTNG